MDLSVLQIIGLGISILGIAGLAIWSGTRPQSYGKVNGAPIVAGIIMGTLVGGSSTVGTAQLAYNYGMSAWWFTLGGGIGCLLVALVYSKAWRNSGSMTLIGIITQEYGPKTGMAASIMSSLGTTSAFVMVLVAMLVAILAGMLYSCLLGIAAIHFKADQTLVGTAMNLLATAAATVFVKAMNTAANPDNHSSEIEYISARKMFIVNIDGFEFNWFMLVAIIAVVLVYFLLYKNRLGLRLMACGEHPQAAASVGVSVYKMRWTGVLMSGALGGLGGLCYILAGVSVWKFENGVAGFGFLALAVMIFGQWKPTRIALAALIFGLFRALSNTYTGFPFLASLNLPGNVYNMMPYIVCLIVLAFTSKASRAPKAEGIPYDKGSR